MAFVRLWCTACGLEIYPDEAFVTHRNRYSDTVDLYHDVPYCCNPYLQEEDEASCP